MYHHKDTYYLYYLNKIRIEDLTHPPSDGVGMATSHDGVHWNEFGCVLPRDEGATGQGTGSVWKAEDFEKSGKFIMNYSTWGGKWGKDQLIRFAESPDLVHWEKLCSEFMFRVDSRWYESTRWDCIYTIPRPGGGRYGYWTASPKGSPGFGFGESPDGRHWTALEPPEMLYDKDGEVGAVERFGDAFYMLYAGGFTTLVAQAPQGPFRLVERNRRFLVGNASYFIRFLPAPDGMLVNHQSWPLVGGLKNCNYALREGKMWFAPLKRGVVDSQGTLRMAYWEGNEELKGRRLDPKTAIGHVGANSGIALSAERLNLERGLVLEAVVQLPADDASRAGLYLETDPRDRGVCLLAGRNGVVEFGSVKSDGSDFTLDADGRWDRELRFGATCRLRLFLRHSMLELYLDDVLIQAHGLREEPTGRIGIIGTPHTSLTDVQMWEMSL